MLGLDSSAKFRGATMAHKAGMLDRHVNVARLFGANTWDTLPTRYLTAYAPPEKLRRLETKGLSQEPALSDTENQVSDPTIAGVG